MDVCPYPALIDEYIRQYHPDNIACDNRIPNEAQEHRNTDVVFGMLPTDNPDK